MGRRGPLLALMLGFGAGTALFGWWAVPIVALVAGMFFQRRRWTLVTIPLVATISWALLLLYDAMAPGFGALTRRLDALFPGPAWALFGTTLVLPAVLAFSAALIGASLVTQRPRPTE